MNNIS